MQVIPGGAPGAAHIADDLPGLHLLARGDADGGAVGVQGLQAVAVVELDVVAIPNPNKDARSRLSKTNQKQ